MILIEPDQGRQIPGLQVPKDLYWVFAQPAPLAGMRSPLPGWPWDALHAAGFQEVVSLDQSTCGPYDPAPLTLTFSQQLQDLGGGGPPPCNETTERELIGQAVHTVAVALQKNRGVVIHCVGGRGRTGTVLGCVMRHLGLPAEKTVLFLDRVHKARGKPGWPESPWQESLVRSWSPPA